MQKNELIRLDASLVDVVDHAVFSAELANGHRFVAIGKRPKGGPDLDVQPPCAVVVEMSPYDMSRGHIVAVSQGQVECSHEST